jgi:hypothetical protein
MTDTEAREYVWKWVDAKPRRSALMGKTSGWDVTAREWAYDITATGPTCEAALAYLGRKLYKEDNPEPEEVDVIKWARSKGYDFMAKKFTKHCNCDRVERAIGFSLVNNGYVIHEECPTEHEARLDLLGALESKFGQPGKKFVFKTSPWGE